MKGFISLKGSNLLLDLHFFLWPLRYVNISHRNRSCVSKRVNQHLSDLTFLCNRMKWGHSFTDRLCAKRGTRGLSFPMVKISPLILKNLMQERIIKSYVILQNVLLVTKYFWMQLSWLPTSLFFATTLQDFVLWWQIWFKIYKKNFFAL